jgi:hypothetical protein
MSTAALGCAAIAQLTFPHVRLLRGQPQLHDAHDDLQYTAMQAMRWHRSRSEDGWHIWQTQLDPLAMHIGVDVDPIIVIWNILTEPTRCMTTVLHLSGPLTCCNRFLRRLVGCLRFQRVSSLAAAADVHGGRWDIR